MTQIEQLELEVAQLKETVKKLQHEYDATRGLWCIDRNPKDVSIDWVRENAFQLTHSKGFVINTKKVINNENRKERLY